MKNKKSAKLLATINVLAMIICTLSIIIAPFTEVKGKGVKRVKELTNIENIKDDTLYDQIYIDKDYVYDIRTNLNQVTVNCTKSFVVSQDNPKYKAIDGVLYSKDGKKLYYLPSEKTNSFVVPNGVESVEADAIYNCSTLTSLDLSEVKYIGYKAITYCKKLKNLKMDNVKKVDRHGIENTGLKKIVIKQKVKLEIHAIQSNDTIKHKKSITQIKPNLYSCNKWYKIKAAKGYEVKVIIKDMSCPKDKRTVKGTVKSNEFDNKFERKMTKQLKELQYNFATNKFEKIYFFSEYRKYILKTKVRAFKYNKNKKIYTKWSDYMTYDTDYSEWPY